jgi:hypothetical protein
MVAISATRALRLDVRSGNALGAVKAEAPANRQRIANQRGIATSVAATQPEGSLKSLKKGQLVQT